MGFWDDFLGTVTGVAGGPVLQSALRALLGSFMEKAGKEASDKTKEIILEWLNPDKTDERVFNRAYLLVEEPWLKLIQERLYNIAGPKPDSPKEVGKWARKKKLLNGLYRMQIIDESFDEVKIAEILTSHARYDEAQWERYLAIMLPEYEEAEPLYTAFVNWLTSTSAAIPAKVRAWAEKVSEDIEATGHTENVQGLNDFFKNKTQENLRLIAEEQERREARRTGGAI